MVVVAWLAARDECVASDALERALQTMAAASPVCPVYVVTKVGDYAQALPIDREWFATPSGAPGAAMGVRRVFSRGLSVDGSRLPTPPQQSARSLGSGWDGLREWLLGWLRAGYAPKSVTPQIIIAERDAARLFGWGVVAAPAPVADVPSNSAVAPADKQSDSLESAATSASDEHGTWKSFAPQWTGEPLAAMRKTLDGRNKTQQLSKRTGLPEREIRRRIKDWRDEVERNRAANPRKAK